MTKEELEKYAHENRKRLDAQEVKIGDVVKVLRGRFAGETGVIVGIIVCGRDYADPYYEVDMDCEVPDKYKCRKNTLAPNNVIGGLSAYEFEVIGNRTHAKPAAPTIEVGSEEWVDKQVWNCKLKQHGVIKRIANGCAEVFTQYGEHKVWSLVDLFDEYDEPFGNWKSVQPKGQTEAEKKPNVGSIKIPVEVDLTDSYWDAYTADLAKEIALKVANKYSDPKEAADYAVSVAKAVVENLKKK